MVDLQKEIVRRVRQNMRDLALENELDPAVISVEETADGVVVRIALTPDPSPTRGEGRKKSRAGRQVEESYGAGAQVEETDDSLRVTLTPDPSPSGRGEEETGGEE